MHRDPLGNRASDQGTRRLRQQHLPAAPDRAQPGRSDHVDAEVALATDSWLTCVQAHAHANRLAVGPLVHGVRALRFDGCRDGVASPREREEERIALRVDLDTAARRKALAHQPAMAGQDLAVLVSERFEQARRPLDVAEDERDGSARQSSHALSMPLRIRPFSYGRAGVGSRGVGSLLSPRRCRLTRAARAVR